MTTDAHDMTTGGHDITTDVLSSNLARPAEASS
jgi:hypothetical protein